ncbi:MAG: hypothetical protein A2017_07960 [Lentisphaerae bacterium GWF2_44_16]|nr:MAG: hypothetical protein A2017_07960 [Lentisphaerae bacterium GWF2_44_16]
MRKSIKVMLMLCISGLFAGSICSETLALDAGHAVKISTERNVWSPKIDNETIRVASDNKNTFNDEKTIRVTVSKMEKDKTVIYTYVKVKPDTEYILEFYYRVEKIEPQDSNFSIILCCNKDGGGNGSDGIIKIPIDSSKAKNEWIKISKRFKTYPETAVIQFCINFSMIIFEGNISSINIIPVQNSFTVARLGADEKINIDGILNEPIWQKADAMTPFFHNKFSDSMPPNKTAAKMAFDDKMLYVAFRCNVEKIEDTKASAKERDSKSLWQDEGVEFFIMPSADDGAHFIINSNGVFSDYKIRSTTWENASGYIQDIKWNSNAQVAAKTEGNSYCIEMTVPLSELGLNTESLKTALVNFCRNDSESNGNDTFSQLRGLFMEPMSFSVMKTEGEQLFVKRFIQSEDKNPYAVERKTKLFSELLSSGPGDFTVSSWNAYGGLKISLKQDKTLSPEDIKRIQQETIEELSKGKEYSLMYEANFRDEGGLSKLREMYEKYGICPMISIENSGVFKGAINRGAEILHPAGFGACPNGTPSVISPQYTEVAIETATKIIERYKNEPYPLIIHGKDEPENGETIKFSRTQNPKSKLIAEFDAKVKASFGFGKYGIPDVKDPKTYEDLLKMRLSWIAFARAWTDEFMKQRIAIYSAIKKIRPNLKFIFMSLNTMGSIGAEDASEYDERLGDIISCDPYASSTSSIIRGKYNHGFATKLLKDITHVPEIMTIVQAFPYRGCDPCADDMNEWVSQSLKAGAKHIQYYDPLLVVPDTYKLKKPNVYKEILKINERISKMNALNIPQTSDMAVLYSLYSYMSDGPTDANEAYTAHVLLGENLHSWFKFVSDRDVEKGKVDLKKYKLIIVPYFRFVTDKISEEILSALSSGSTVVFCDPRSFDYDIEGNSKAGTREKVFGVKRGEPINQKRMIFSSVKGEFPLYKRCQFLSQKEDNVFSINVNPASASVIARYPDNSPAAVKGKYGKGTFYYFAANPLVSDILSGGNNWSDFFRTVLAENSIDMNCRIWDFHISGK